MGMIPKMLLERYWKGPSSIKRERKAFRSKEVSVETLAIRVRVSAKVSMSERNNVNKIKEEGSLILLQKIVARKSLYSPRLTWIKNGEEIDK